ncbi:MAG: insulinase family protein [Clostridia bacterium]|nr:insulinase family protein [Clostridia bacterium]
MYKITVEHSQELDESTFSTTLSNGLKVFICKKKNFSKKIGMFGTKYGSVINDFIDITTGERTKVPDGIAHFLEHKLFEKEGANALDLFSKMGVSSNAYTSFDQTVYFFETSEKFEESIAMLVKLIKEPYFTDENVQKEQGIIGQEISMYDDNPNFMVYFNALRAMYQKNPVRIDIAGTIESISHITKEMLYTCYNTFYSPQNMFFLVVGDVDVEKTIDIIEENIKKYGNNVPNTEITTFMEEEPKEITQKEIVQKMDIYLPQLCIGYKLDLADGKNIVKNECIVSILSDMYFSKLSYFFEKEYNEGKVNDSIDMQYEGSDSFSHVIISTTAVNIDEVEKDILEYINKIKNEPIDKELFEIIKRKKIGEMILASDSLNISYRRIIDSILNDVDVYTDMEMLKSITPEDLQEFLAQLNDENQVSSKIIAK